MSRQAENRLPETFDGLMFAGEGKAVAARVPVATLSRLADVLADVEGDLDCRVSGSLDGDGNHWLTVEVSGALRLVCQRCLGPLVYPVEVRSSLLLIPPGQPLPDDELAEDGFDAIEAEKEMALLPLIEEEVLLALPIAPRHEVCETPAAAGEEDASSPFAALAKLKKGA